MGKNSSSSKGNKRNARCYEDECDSITTASSDQSFITGNFDNESSETTELDILAQALEDTNNKQSRQRLKGLENILLLFRSTSDIILLISSKDNRESIIDIILKIIRRPASEKEGMLALSIFVLLCMSSGPDNCELFEQISPSLIQMLTRNENVPLRCTAIMALSLGCLFCTSFSDRETWQLIEDVLCGVSDGLESEPIMRACAATAWSLLCSGMPVDLVLASSNERVFEV